MRHLASTLPAGANLFSSPPPNPRINQVLRRNELAPPPLTRRAQPAKSPADSPALKAAHRRTKYHKPVPPAGGVIAADEHERKVVVGESGVSYLLPGAPFEFQFSYSETPKAKPLAIREPAFLPFVPPSMPRPWTGKAPLKSKKEKDLKKQRRVRLLDPIDLSEQDDPTDGISQGKVLKISRSKSGLVQCSSDTRTREEILGKPLSSSEIKALVKPHLSDNRQINLGRDGLTHNMLELIHTHWRRRKVCKVRCRGVPTVDMDNVCHHLEEKTGGKIIYRIGGVIYLFRGRNYDPQTRPRFPTMLWKPAAPVYPKLIQEIPEGLTRDEVVYFRKKGESLLPICKLAKNGIYITLVRNVRDAFEGSPLVKIDCRGLHASDYKKIGAKLKELVPCVLLSFDDDQILMWRGRDWKSKYPKPVQVELSATGIPSKRVEGKIARLWRRAVESGMAMLLPERVCPDSLLHQVELFEASSQSTDHSFPALISEVSDAEVEQDGDATDGDSSDVDDDCLLDLPESPVPFGSLAVDSLTRHLYLD